MPDVAQWLAEARAGSREALGQALEACRAYLLLIAGQELDSDLQAKGGASDLVQETFFEAQRDFARFQGDGPEEWRAWLRKLLLHNLADFTRGYRETAKRGGAREVPLDGDGSADGPAGALAAADTPVGDRLIAAEQAEAFRQALERLPDDYRRVILLRYQDQLSFEEIGKVFLRTPNAARMLWLRAVERLKGEMGMPS
jgi:RNA polymerase sigma-70 factor (ECF subfamily)